MSTVDAGRPLRSCDATSFGEIASPARILLHIEKFLNVLKREMAWQFCHGDKNPGSRGVPIVPIPLSVCLYMESLFR